MQSELGLFESAATLYMSNAIGSICKSNLSRRICHLRTVLLDHVADKKKQTSIQKNHTVLRTVLLGHVANKKKQISIQKNQERNIT